MTVLKTVLLSFLLGIVVAMGACSRERVNDRTSEQSGQGKTVDQRLISFIKDHKLASFQSRTIGNAFDSYRYLTNKAWKLEHLEGGYFAVKYSGWFEPMVLNEKDVKDGVKGKGLEVTFVINPDGSFYLFIISSFEVRADGVVYRNQLSDHAIVLKSIYANRKLDL